MKKFFIKSINIFLISLVVVNSVFAASTSTKSFKVFLTVNQETPAVTPAGGGGGGSGAGTNFPVITDIVVAPSIHGATITYKTSVPTTDIVSFGKTSTSFSGSISNNNFLTNHSVTLTNLSADTLYYFSIDVVSQTNGRATSGIGKFNTLKIIGVTNVLAFTATAETSDIRLDWKMPKAQENSTVRIVRSESFYPTNINDGITIFEGAGNTNYVDINVVAGVRYYYTLFIKGANGIYSSGAVADAKILLAGEKPETQKELFDRLAQAPNVDPRISSLTLKDFIFSQPDRDSFSTEGNETLFIEGDKDLTIKLSYERVPELLKTIAVTLTDPDDINRKFSFLLRVNDDKTFYEATIAPLGRSGEYKMDVAIVDYKNQGLKRIQGSLLAVVSKAFVEEGVFTNALGFTANDLMMALVFVLAMIALSYLSARRIDLSYLRQVWSRYRRIRK